MELKRTLGVFASGCLVYAAMAACSGNGNMLKSSGGTTGGGMGGHGGAPEDSGIMDALTDPVPDVNASPGTRLKGKFYLSDDGAKEYQYTLEKNGNSATDVHQLWYDSMRQEDCAFGTADDGKVRCLPTDSVFWDGFYADDQCTIGLASVPGPPIQCNFTPPKYAILLTYDACSNGHATKSVFLLGQPVDLGPNPGVYVKKNGTCVGNGNVGLSGTYKVGAQVPTSSFAAATAGIDP